MKKLIPLLLIACGAGAFVFKEGVRGTVFFPEAIRAHMRFLSSDLLKGRATGSAGYDIAAQYMISQFEKHGLNPAFGDSSFLQQVSVAEYNMDYSGSALAAVSDQGTRLLVNDEDYLIYSNGNIEDVAGKAEIAFAGYGLDYESFSYEAYQGIDMKGKVAAVIWGEPDFVGKNPQILFHDKIRKAYELGAVGIVFILPARFQETISWGRIKYFLGSGLELKNHMGSFFTIVLNPKAVVDAAGYSADSLRTIANQRNFKPFMLNRGLSYHLQTNRNETLTTSYNVAAMLPGSDPYLKDEYVVYTAHLDHVGTGTPVNGDSIYNGAYDNATGCAILLEIARAFSQQEQPPLRSILFVALTGEEIGLFGSEYFVNFPPVPIQNIVTNINIDMVLLEQPLDKAVALGKEYADFENIVDQAALELDIELIPDPIPAERLFMRSDHYSFVQKGIPSLFIINDLSDSLNNAWFKQNYHSVKDEISDSMHFEAAAKHAHLDFLIGDRVARANERPKWKKNSPYGMTAAGK